MKTQIKFYLVLVSMLCIAGSAFAQLTFDHAFSNAFVRSLEKQTGSIIRNNYIGIEIGIMH